MRRRAIAVVRLLSVTVGIAPSSARDDEGSPSPASGASNEGLDAISDTQTDELEELLEKVASLDRAVVPARRCAGATGYTGALAMDGWDEERSPAAGID